MVGLRESVSLCHVFDRRERFVGERSEWVNSVVQSGKPGRAVRATVLSDGRPQEFIR